MKYPATTTVQGHLRDACFTDCAVILEDGASMDSCRLKDVVLVAKGKSDIRNSVLIDVTWVAL